MYADFHSFFHSASRTAGSAALLGICLHQAVRIVEFELYMYHFIALSSASFLCLVYTLIQLEGLSLAGAFLQAAIFATSFNTALLLSTTVYRLVFHRCRKFPGPLPAKISRFYAAYLSAKDVQYFKELAKVHAKYGDFVRTGMLPFDT
jgi:hypothetical protein